MSDEGEEDDWLEGGEGDGFNEVTPGAGKGILVTKSYLGKFLGIAPKTLDKLFKAGAPVEKKGNRKEGWKINSALFSAWKERRAVEIATGNAEAGDFDAAKTREKEAQARLKEIQIEERLGNVVTIDEVTALYAEELTVLRSRLLAIPNRVGHDAAIQDAIRIEIIDALADITGRERESRDGESQDEESESESD